MRIYDLKTAELAALLGVSPRQVSRYVAAGLPCSATPGGHARFDRSEVVRWLREQKKMVPAGLRGAA